MKNLYKMTIITILASFLMTGCAVKDTDSILEKTLKHSANSPLYVLVGTGALVEYTLQRTIVGAANLAGSDIKIKK